MESDWRLARGQETYLSRATVVWKPYRAGNEGREHDHCEFCWAKFMDATFSEEHRTFIEEHPDIRTAGYSTLGTGPEGDDSYRWICEDCFNDFREQFAWRVVTGPAPDQ
jgi:hypothetical protein